MRTIKYIMAAMIVFITSCGEDFVELSNPNLLTSGSFWQTETDAQLGANALYQALIYDGTYMRFGPWIMDVRADDALSVTPGYYPEDVANYIVDAANIAYSFPWEHNYIGVWRANQVLDNVSDIPMDESLKSRILGEAHFIRGLCYFNLLNLFRNIVIYEHVAQSTDDYYIPQSAPEESWDLVIRDFTDAVDLLWTKDVTETGRATKGAAAAFLAKSLMINQRFSEAAPVLLDIINTVHGGNQKYGLYDLVPEFRDNFTEANENNIESLFEIQYDGEIPGLSVQGFTGDPASDWLKTDAHHKGLAAQPFGWGDLAPNPWIYEKFQEEKTLDDKWDPRMEASLLFEHPGDTTYKVYGYDQSKLQEMTFATPDVVPDNYKVFIRKWLTENETVELAWRSGINRRIMRYDDVLLLYAECMNEANNRAEAAKFVQIIRDRVGLADREAEFAALSQEGMRDRIDHERLLEFAFEGWRYVDMLRWGWFDPNSPNYKIDELKARDPEYINWTPGREYMAIPPTEIERTNGIVRQNPGWN
ncbi:MAG: RagB/SusD family nutrient uptake outer membrane protein [Bacteroidales bacterium]|nr:RagB/SusD family nutrient uptake outer membrane protein [Bacteroidales bacterium]MBN2762057.1 RagB/SusD family nutrient uptake outer membrane protein [Bacteroidales bacterium]